MINPAFLTDELAEKIAENYLLSKHGDAVLRGVFDHLKTELTKSIAKAQEEEKEEVKTKQHFDKLFAFLLPYERKFEKKLKSIWEEERKIIIANLKKIRKAYLRKDEKDDIVDNILYPRKQMEKKLVNETRETYIDVMEKSGQRELDRLGVEATFDVENPKVKEWLDAYIFKFAKNLEKKNVEKLRMALKEGLKAGEGVPKLQKRINGIFSDWSKRRAYDVARNEALRSANKANVMAMRQSGIVCEVRWLAFRDKLTCFFCEDMDGKVIRVEKTFWNVGDKVTATREGKTYTMEVTYEDVDGGNLHSRCRCTTVAHSYNV